MKKVIGVKNEPKADEQWRGIGGHFDSLTQIINELLDNAISAILSVNTDGERKIIVSLTELPNGEVKIVCSSLEAL